MSHSHDSRYMEIALGEARQSFADGNFPVGAILVIDGKVIDKARNLLRTNADWISHAEMNLLMKHSSHIKQSKSDGCTTTIYTTFEPCLMCLGACALHRVSRVVYAASDNFTGAAHIDFKSLSSFYQDMDLKVVETHACKDESRELVLQYMNANMSPKWEKAKNLIEDTK